MYYLTLAILCSLAACGGGTADPGSPTGTGGTSKSPLSCDVPLDSCSPSKCYVVEGIRLEERGCLHDGAEPVGCAAKDSVFHEVLTGAVGPDGVCWRLFNSTIPYGFTYTEECDRQSLRAATCAD
jgi:hypothetical protein